MTDENLIKELGVIIFEYLCKRGIRLKQGCRVLAQLNLGLGFEENK